ncbi:UDP-2,3-diacylglucosamine diphosphatase LpxI [Hoeflea sp. YIM 152468]|uniref:LpxI family protein n=1 Tax=Hoeflea sp. YIM 152468 TaxID=3031759 RepID=UPI0023DA5B49|nr:UDP-2,3-diacylglucosamine diphosphatase LpxI [Hoeflea sp. YIM 152468]MDF1607340.1 UDP-2,3-diacylglucosamine diphosphatase LpxI [Hoeflea sp. YIM 152468]
MPDLSGRLAILAGKGRFPVLVARAARDMGHNPFIVAIRGEADQDWSGFDHCQISIADLAQLARTIRREAIGSVVFAGGIDRRPDLANLRPTWRSLMALPAFLRVFAAGGDDKILRFAIRVLEKEGVKVLAAQQIAPDLLGTPGPLAQMRPGKSDWRDIEAAGAVALALGRLDVGQGSVSVGGRVIALEGLEGTDAMLARVKELRASKRLTVPGGVLVKMCKPDQDERADLPSIGPLTVINAHAAGLAGIAVEAGRALVLEREQVIDEANRLGLFVIGIKPANPEAVQCQP